jgi:tetratricopeptide (TPR) repeat protein
MSEVVDALLMKAAEARREHRSSYARHVLLDAVNLCRKSNDRERLAKALSGLGQTERDLHHLDSARQHYDEAAAIYHDAGNELRLAHTVRHIADICMEEGNHALAGQCYQAALDLYRKHPEARRLDVANTLRGMAILNGDLGRNQEAKAMWEEAGRIYAAEAVTAGVSESKRRLAQLL